MAILLAPISGPESDWRALLAKALPGREVRYYPEIGDPASIDVACVARIPRGFLASLPNLRLICSLFAGQEVLLADPTLPKNVPIVRTGNTDGDRLMDENALMHVLRHHRGLPDYALAQQRHEWARKRVLRPHERTVGVMGLGPIGLGVAQCLARHGFKTAAWARSKRALDGIEVFAGRGELPAFLGRSEIVVCLLPLTRETENILDRAAFAAMPKGGAVINLARGQHVVEGDLMAALDAGHLNSATLDVFREEPLPKESPIWAHPRITLMPHVSRRHDPVDIAPRIAEHVERLERGEPPQQVVDREAGY
ncbi:MAG TPA: glyoxylate/hydroxypyruvate reductase A [Stellaceae bacterium]|nr:glyoxylate/hydroxypyruvate reductase A [Stellaceae bacterium]